MIIFFNKVSGEIYGTVSGRVHDADQIARLSIHPSNVAIDEVEKYVAPTEIIYTMEPITELRADSSGLVRRVTTNKRQKKASGVRFVGPNAELIEKFDNGSEKTVNYLLQHDDKGDYIFTKKQL